MEFKFLRKIVVSKQFFSLINLYNYMHCETSKNFYFFSFFTLIKSEINKMSDGYSDDEDYGLVYFFY